MLPYLIAFGTNRFVTFNFIISAFDALTTLFTFHYVLIYLNATPMQIQTQIQCFDLFNTVIKDIMCVQLTNQILYAILDDNDKNSLNVLLLFFCQRICYRKCQTDRVWHSKTPRQHYLKAPQIRNTISLYEDTARYAHAIS